MTTSKTSIKFDFKNVSLKWKIYFYLVGFCGMLILLLWLFQVVFLDVMYKNVKIQEVNRATKLLEGAINDGKGDRTIFAICQEFEVNLYIIDSDGGFVDTTTATVENFVNKISKEERIRLFNIICQYEGKRQQFLYQKDDKFNPQLNDDIRTFSDSILCAFIFDEAENGKEYMALVNSVIVPMNSNIKTMQTILVYITCLMLFLSLLLSLMISRKISRPIEEINFTAKKMATDSDIKFDGRGYREINELNDSLNDAAKELKKVDDLRKELIANISHDLRTPLTLINGYAEIMRDLPGENNFQNAQCIVDESQRLSRLVGDLLDMSKIQAGGKLGLNNLSEFNLTEVATKLVHSFKDLLKSDKVNFTLNTPFDVNVRGDEVLIEQAIYNLLSNAVNYSGEIKEITLNVSITEDEYAKVSVTDNGEGIDANDLKYIWDRYYRVDKTHKRAIMGTGIGLSIVKGIITAHKGRCGVSSEKNIGSTFWLEIPILKEPND